MSNLWTVTATIGKVRVSLDVTAWTLHQAKEQAKEQIAETFGVSKLTLEGMLLTGGSLDADNVELATDHDPDCSCGQCQENDRLGYDADVSDPRQYCRHGTFIGSWWGPDYLCAACEMGE